MSVAATRLNTRCWCWSWEWGMLAMRNLYDFRPPINFKSTALRLNWSNLAGMTRSRLLSVDYLVSPLLSWTTTRTTTKKRRSDVSRVRHGQSITMCGTLAPTGWQPWSYHVLEQACCPFLLLCPRLHEPDDAFKVPTSFKMYHASWQVSSIQLSFDKYLTWSCYVASRDFACHLFV